MRVAVIGLANSTPTKPTTMYSFAENPLQVLSETIQNVQEEHPNVIVVLVHEDLRDVRRNTQSYVADIATYFGGQVHVVLGGHAHQIVENEHINGVLFSECGTALQYVSKITVEVSDDTGKVTSTVGKLIPLIVDQVGEDAQIKTLAESLREPGIDEPLGETTAMVAKDPLKQEQLDSPLNDWIVDIIAQYSGADVVINNINGTHTDLPKGIITERDLIEIMPFDDKIVTMPVTGQFLEELVRETFGLFVFSGLEILYTQQPDGVRKIMSLTVNGNPIQPNKIYTLAANKFVAFGKKGDKETGKFTEIPDQLKQRVGEQTLRGLMKENLQVHSPIEPPQTGRIRQIEPRKAKDGSGIKQDLQKELINLLQKPLPAW